MLPRQISNVDGECMTYERKNDPKSQKMLRLQILQTDAVNKIHELNKYQQNKLRLNMILKRKM